MRGKRWTDERALALAGITPAHAGKTTQAAVIALSASDHPRACGENWTMI